MFLKQSTSAIVLVGPVLDASGAAVTTAVIGDFTLTKNGTSAAMAGNTISHSHNGHYAITLTVANTDTIGRLTISVNNTAQAMPVFRWDVCQPTVYDALFTNAVNTTGGLPAATAQITALAGAISTFAGGAVASVTGSVGSVTAAVTVETNNDKTGYSLTQVFPANFAALGINSSGHVSRVTLVDTTTTNTDMRGTDNAALASNWTATRAGYLDSVLLAANSNRTVQITGSSHVAAVVHDVEPAAIPEDAFVDNAISARAIATDAVNEIQNGLARADALATLTGYVDTEVAAIKTVTDRISTGLVADGAVWQFTANMLELAPAGGGGGGSGDATLANQVLILDQLDVIQSKTDLISGASGITSLLAGAVLDPGSITSFPEVLTVGDSYTEANGRAIQIPIVDTNGVPISSTGSLYFSSATVTFVIKRAGETDSDRIISGTATFVDPPGTGTGDEAPYAVIELLSSETSKGLMKYKYTGILTFTWPGTSDEVMSFETNTITFRE